MSRCAFRPSGVHQRDSPVRRRSPSSVVRKGETSSTGMFGVIPTRYSVTVTYFFTKPSIAATVPICGVGVCAAVKHSKTRSNPAPSP